MFRVGPLCQKVVEGPHFIMSSLKNPMEAKKEVAEAACRASNPEALVARQAAKPSTS
jgi:hypothetical protein